MTRVDRPYTRRAGLLQKVRSAASSASPMVSSASTLAASAGLLERPSVEALEKRQMLFALSVTADQVDPDTGIGTVSGFFGYHIPFAVLTEELPEPQDPEQLVEDFNDEPIGAVGSGQVFDESNFLVRHNVVPGRDIRVGSDQPPPDQSERFLFLDLRRVGEFASFQVFTEGENPEFTSATQVAFTIAGNGAGDLSGLFTDNIAIDLILSNQVVETITGQDLRDAIQGDQLRGTGLVTLQGTQDNPRFDTFRIRVITEITGGVTGFRMDDVSFTVPQGRFADALSGGIFGAEIHLTGPVGARVDVTDLYGRDMLLTLALFTRDGAIIFDRDDDGRVEANDGIGTIRLSNVDSRTALTIWGGTIEFAEDPPEDAEFVSGNYVYQRADSLQGQFDDFEDAGFGYLIDSRDDQPEVNGLPDGNGSVVIGSPFVRPQGDYDPEERAPGFPEFNDVSTLTTGFNNPNQGIFVDGGNAMGSIYVHGVVHGASVMSGAVDKIYVGYMVGSLTVRGDLGLFTVGSDAGLWAPDEGIVGINNEFDTGGQLVVERTLGRVDIAARSLMDVTVVGDLNSPTTRPARDVYTFYEQEFVYSIVEGDEEDVVQSIINSDLFIARQPSDRFRGTDQAAVFAGGTYRNDSLMGAEFINSISTAVRIVGDMSGRDPANGEDSADVFGFATDGVNDVIIDVTGNVALARVVDQDGRTLAAPQLGVGAERVAFNGQFRFKPQAPGIYYLVLTDGQLGDDGAGSSDYSVGVSGLASVSVGSIRTGASLGVGDVAPNITILSGDMGALRVGTGFVAGDGGDEAPDNYNNPEDLNDDDALTFRGVTLSAPGNLFGVVAGSDIGNVSLQGLIGAVRMTIGGNLGMLQSGQSPAVGRSTQEGDANFMNLAIGGSIGTVDIRGGIGMDQDNEDPRGPISGVDSVVIRTGLAGGRGDLGLFRTGFSVVGDALNVRVSPGSTIGAFLVAQDPAEYQDALGLLRAGDEQPDDDRFGVYDGLRGIPLTTGAGSSVRFVDVPHYDISNGTNARTDLDGDEAVEFVDDSGARAIISIDGFSEGVIGRVVALPVDGSQGVAVALIDVDLSGGRTLNIQGVGNGGSFQIGRIRVSASDANSRIVIGGGVEIDVYRIDMDTGAGAILEITNSTLGGDIVAIDVAGVTNVQINGNLGTTEVAAWGPKLIGPELGVAPDLVGGVGGALGFLAEGGFIDPDFGGEIYRPINLDTAQPAEAFLDDVGGPLDFSLNGLVVRGGDLTDIQVRGSIRDLILEGDGATILSARANSDNVTPFGGFDGIVGNVYAANIGSLNIGDGLVASDGGPLLSAGIVAADDINEIRASRPTGARIGGVIVAANSDDAINTDGSPQGINSIHLDNGIYDGAFIGSTAIDAFWSGLLYGDANIYTGNVQSVTGSNTNFFRSVLRGEALQQLEMSNGYFDASTVNATGRIESIRAKGFRNSTLLGGPLELRQNVISGAGDLNELSAVEDIEDLVLDVTGSVIGSISSRHLTRSTLDVDNNIQNVSTRGSVKSSAITAGQLLGFSAADAIESSSFFISGPISGITAGSRIANTKIEVTGPDGRIDSITARDLVSGDITSSGPIGTIRSTLGDLAANIRTTSATGNVSNLQAGRDVVAFTDIAGDLGSITAGRNIGTQSQKGVVLVRGNFNQASATAGQLYSDIRAGGNIGSVTVGRIVNKPGNNAAGSGSIIAFGRVGSVNITGDFGGDVISYSGGISNVTITNGSLLPGRTVSAFAGDLNNLTITNGNLLGNVYADFDIKSLIVTRAADAVFGNVGVLGDRSQFTSYDGFRNQLPPGVAPTTARDGARVVAGRNIVSVNVAGSVSESVFQAGRAIRNITIGGNVSSDFLTSSYTSAFVAGDSIDAITVNGTVDHAQFLAGVVNLGADNRPGGLNANADTVKSGTITRVAVNGATTNTQFLAGMSAGLDGQYGSTDDRVALGSSTINNLTLGTANNVLAQADSLASSVANDARLIRLTEFASVDPLLDNGLGTPGSAVVSGQAINFQGGTITFTMSGPGEAFFNAGTGRLTLRNTTTGTSLAVTSSLATLNNLSIVSNDDAALGTLRVTPALSGTSQFVIDGNIGTLDLAAFSGNGRVTVGGDIATATLGTFTSGTLTARNIQTLNATGDFGAATPGLAGRPVVRSLTAGTMTFRGAMRGIVSVDRDVSSVTIIGAVDRGDVRVGGGLSSFTSAATNRLVLSVGETLGSVQINGNAFDTAILAGVDLGSDAAFGGTGTAADRATTASIGSVSVTGTFLESDIIAGYLRGPDGFYGTSDDTVAPGLSTIGSVTIGGNSVGSTRFSESYRIASSGDVGQVRVGGAVLNGPRGNFAVEAGRGQLAPVNIRPIDIKVTAESGQYVAELSFNQPIDFSTIKAGLSVSEVRGSTNVTIRLIEGIDYTISYNASTSTTLVRFSRDITTRNLPRVPGLPGPGVYRFELDQAIVRGKSLAARIDGDNDGFTDPTDDFVGHAVVGDAGDKLFDEVATAGSGASATPVDFFDHPPNADGPPDPNQNFVPRGMIGDHPDNDAINFPFAGDTDVYSFTLQAGQILRLSALRGAASQAPVTLVDPNNTIINDLLSNGQGFLGLDTQNSVVLLPSNTEFIAQQLISDTAYLIKTTGTYRIIVGQIQTVDQPGEVFDADNIIAPGSLGAYEMDLFIFDDGDSGFASSSDSGNGERIVNAPEGIVFAGNDGVFNTGDDVPSVVIGGYTFTISAGADSILGNTDDVVSGSNADGHTATRSGGVLTTSISSSIGPAAHAGIPGDVFSDVDIYQLNNGAAITPGTRMRVTIDLSKTGSNLGSAAFVGNLDANVALPTDQSGYVNFGLFETTGLTNVNDQDVADARLIFSPGDFEPFAASGARVIADNGSTKYGYDANGNFYIEFVTPDSVVSPGTAGSYALYLQGVFNSDYTLEVVTGGTGTLATTSQNFLIETNGGTLDWLEAGNIETAIAPFSAASLGFRGFITGNQTADEYILSNLLSQLNSLFAGAGYDVTFSTNPADFEFQPFSTIYLSGTNDPINTLFESFDFATQIPLPGQALQNTPVFSTQPFGFSEHSDPFNADIEDEAVVFAPTFSLLGLTPSRADVDVFTDSLTGAVARRAGELLGLRLTTDDANNNPAFDPFAANSATVFRGFPRNFTIPGNDRQLSSDFDSVSDTNFFLGRQDAGSLLDKILSRV